MLRQPSIDHQHALELNDRTRDEQMEVFGLGR